ncbi:MAG: (d)CMP kinase [Firmicutes bacterium]|nr:(d)CMP kinase [Bacillota bacterium]
MTDGRGKEPIIVERKGQKGRRGRLVAIDGPAGAGKSTVARRVADRLGYLYIDTGGMYRALTLKALRVGVDPGDGAAVARLASSTRISVDSSGRILLDGEDVTAAIRCPAVSAAVSRVAGWPAVRKILTRRMRELAGCGGAVLEGRDVGTCVVPHADCKVFLTASPEERAKRRWRELREAGYAVSLAEVYENLVTRDRADSSRGLAPLTVAEDAVVIDTTDLDVEETVEAVLRLCTDR